MSEIEARSAKRRKRTNLKKAILGTLLTSGALAVAMLAPNVLGVIAKSAKQFSRRQVESINAARKRLVEQGYISASNGKFTITTKGEKELRMLDGEGYELKKPKRWDGRWRVLIFDIPEKRKTLRNKLRNTLMHVGFTRVQDSVWLYPYESEDFVALLKADFLIGKELLYLIVDSLEEDVRYRSLFNLN